MMNIKNVIPRECEFTPEMVFDYCRTLKLKMGLWIDLTNTDRFYSRTVVEAHGAEYVKLKCRGHGEIPSLEETRAFIETVNNFIVERPFDIIGVHGTHGFNRAGFLFTSYLTKNVEFSLEADLFRFSQARSPGIYKQNHINELYRRFGRKQEAEATPAASQLPDWSMKFSDCGENCKYGAKRKRLVDDDNANKEKDFNDENNNDVCKKTRQEESNTKYKKECNVYGRWWYTWCDLCARSATFKRASEKSTDCVSGGFPGSQPVSMDSKNITKLSAKSYRVSWKACGRRYSMA